VKVAVIGAVGQLGTDVCRVFSDVELYRVSREGADVALDIRDADLVYKLIVEQLGPDLVINAAAANNVPRCQEEPDWAFAVNATGTKNLAVACERAGARLVHVSTDYVFGEGGTRPYVETDLPAPLNVYGASKLAGEHLLAAECEDYIIARTSAIYGVAPCRGKGGRNFVDLMLHLASTRPEVKVVTDEIISPTYTYALAKQLRLVAELGEPGLYHVTCNGECSWHEFAKAIFEETGVAVKLLETTSEDFPSPVRRPRYSVLQNKHLQDQGLDIMPKWRDGLKAYLASVG
jgi:dTDP-4-dehydrorhamnose reductase